MVVFCARCKRYNGSESWTIQQCLHCLTGWFPSCWKTFDTTSVACMDWRNTSPCWICLCLSRITARCPITVWVFPYMYSHLHDNVFIIFGRQQHKGPYKLRHNLFFSETRIHRHVGNQTRSTPNSGQDKHRFSDSKQCGNNKNVHKPKYFCSLIVFLGKILADFFLFDSMLQRTRILSSLLDQTWCVRIASFLSRSIVVWRSFMVWDTVLSQFSGSYLELCWCEKHLGEVWDRTKIAPNAEKVHHVVCFVNGEFVFALSDKNHSQFDLYFRVANLRICDKLRCCRSWLR